MLDLKSKCWHQKLVFQNQIAIKMSGLNHYISEFNINFKDFNDETWSDKSNTLVKQEIVALQVGSVSKVILGFMFIKGTKI